MTLRARCKVANWARKGDSVGRSGRGVWVLILLCGHGLVMVGRVRCVWATMQGGWDGNLSCLGASLFAHRQRHRLDVSRPLLNYCHVTATPDLPHPHSPGAAARSDDVTVDAPPACGDPRSST